MAFFTDPNMHAPQGIATGPDGNLWFTDLGTVRGAIGRITPGTEPGAPTGLTAVPGNAQVSVSWSSGPTGGVPTTGYTVTASPGGHTCQWTTGPLSCTVTGLTNGTPYAFTVTAHNGSGSSPASLPTTPVTPTVSAAYHPVTPARILDSRGPVGGWHAPLAAGTPRDLQVTGLGGGSSVPATASAVVLNVTATGGNANSFVTAYPTGTPKPIASNLNFGVGQTIANLVTVGTPGSAPPGSSTPGDPPAGGPARSRPGRHAI
jgi:hypothetical protein